MRQILNLPSTPECRNASTCSFSVRKGRCARGFRNLPHTSDGRFRKCGEKQKSAYQTPVLLFREQRFCWQKSRCARRFPIFPRTSGERSNTEHPEAENVTNILWKTAPERKKAFQRFPRTKPDAPSQGLITVLALRKFTIPVNPLPKTVAN